MASGVDSLIDIFSGSVSISFTSLIINLVISVLLSGILGFVYTRFGTSISNRASLAKNFVLIAMTTTLIIMVVKSSLALSLGLVGALSIVRFRTAIKEPEELAYLFLTIAIGLGLGADQTIITIVAVVIILIVIILGKLLFRKPNDNSNLHMTISSHGPDKIKFNQILDILNKYCKAVNLKRLDETNDLIEMSFIVDLKDIYQLNNIKEDLAGLSKNVRITFMDYHGVL